VPWRDVVAFSVANEQSDVTVFTTSAPSANTKIIAMSRWTAVDARRMVCVGGDSCSRAPGAVVSATCRALYYRVADIKWDCAYTVVDDRLLVIHEDVYVEKYTSPDDAYVRPTTFTIRYALRESGTFWHALDVVLCAIAVVLLALMVLAAVVSRMRWLVATIVALVLVVQLFGPMPSPSPWALLNLAARAIVLLISSMVLFVAMKCAGWFWDEDDKTPSTGLGEWDPYGRSITG